MSSSTAKRRMHEERNLKTLRELAALPSNKQCFDCSQRGPTYVNVTIGSFVCTSCSGILRGLHPPHRVKSITMTSFTPEEIEFIKTRGNEYCKYVWLGTYDSRTSTEPDIRDEQRIRDFMIQKYERKRWYVDPDIAMRKMKQDHAQQSASSSAMDGTTTPEVKPLSGLLGDQPPPLVIEPVQDQTRWASSNKAKATSDFSKEFNGDPFRNSSSAGDNFTANGNFANFEDAFSSAASNNSNQASATHTALSSLSSSSLSSSHSHQSVGAFLGVPVSTAALTSRPSSDPPPSDRYAALADLDNLFHQETTSTPFGAMSSSGQSWTATSSTSAAPIQPFGTAPADFFAKAVSSNPFSSVGTLSSVSSNQSVLPTVSPSNPFQLGNPSPAPPAAAFTPAFPAFGAASSSPSVSDSFAAFGNAQPAAPAASTSFFGSTETTNFFGVHSGKTAVRSGSGIDAWGSTPSFGNINLGHQPTLVAESATVNDVPVAQSSFSTGQFVGWFQPQGVQNTSNPFTLEVGSTIKTNPSNPFL